MDLPRSAIEEHAQQPTCPLVMAVATALAEASAPAELTAEAKACSGQEGGGSAGVTISALFGGCLQVAGCAEPRHVTLPSAAGLPSRNKHACFRNIPPTRARLCV